MSSDGVLILKTLFGPVWSLFTSWHIPGTRVTPAAWGVFCLFFVFILRFLKKVLRGDGDK